MNQGNNGQGYSKFEYIEGFKYSKGWDKDADDYINLLQPDTVYSLTKDLIHAILLDYVPAGKPIKILDLNCGTGNDFPFFLQQGWRITGCDGSAGMLNKAYEKYADAIHSGQLELYQGMMEDLNVNSFRDQKFDLIFSVTGGYSYIDNDTFVKTNQVLSHYLEGDGLLITAHLNTSCLAEILYHIVKLNRKSLLIRFKKNLTVTIKGEPFRMYLRSPSQLKKLTVHGLELVKIMPLLALTPPYQTGYGPRKWIYKLHHKLEMRFRKVSLLSSIADQVVTIYRRK